MMGARSSEMLILCFVRRYSAYLKSNPKDVYDVQFDQMYEQSNSFGTQAQVALASLNWVFTKPGMVCSGVTA